MSAEALGYVFRFSPYTGATFAVHLAIGDLVNDVHGDELWARVANLAKKARCSRASAKRALGELVAGGDLVILTAPVDGRGMPTGHPGRYRFVQVPDRPPVFEVAHHDPPQNVGVAHHDPPGGSPRPTRVAHHDPPKTQVVNSTKLNGARARAFGDEFDEVWKAYPRKLARKAAERAFVASRRRGVDLDVLTRATVEYARRTVRDRTDPQWVKHGSTFYGPDEHWRDYLDSEPEIDDRNEATRFNDYMQEQHRLGAQ